MDLFMDFFMDLFMDFFSDKLNKLSLETISLTTNTLVTLRNYVTSTCHVTLSTTCKRLARALIIMTKRRC